MSTSTELRAESESPKRQAVIDAAIALFMAHGYGAVSMDAIARTAGWTAHVIEQLADNRLIRPQSVYTGPVGLKVTPIEQR